MKPHDSGTGVWKCLLTNCPSPKGLGGSRGYQRHYTTFHAERPGR